MQCGIVGYKVLLKGQKMRTVHPKDNEVHQSQGSEL